MFQGTILLLATAVYADHKNHKNKKENPNPKPSKPVSIIGPATLQHSKRLPPKPHSFVRHTRKLKLSQPLKHKLKPAPRKASPRQSIKWQKPKGPLRNAPLRKFPRKLPNVKSRQATGLPVRLPAFQNLYGLRLHWNLECPVFV